MPRPVQRAALLVGVRDAKGFPRLQAVDDGLRRMQAWAAAQPGFDDGDGEPVLLTLRDDDDRPQEVERPSRVITLSDADGTSVRAAEVCRWIRAFVELGTVEQLLVYFAGHGVNVGLGEYWLLSNALKNPTEAVNVRGSADLAAYAGIPHVVLVSDACRVPAATLGQQVIQGTLVFPSDTLDRAPGQVDVFYASRVGRPALEVRDPAEAAAGFVAVYTEALAEGLGGVAPEVIEPVPGVAPPTGYVRPWPLARYLAQRVPALLKAKNAPAHAVQEPHAVISSPPEVWLATVPVGAAPPAAAGSDVPPPPPPPAPAALAPTLTRGVGGAAPPPAPAPVARVAPTSLGALSHRALGAALRGLGDPYALDRSGAGPGAGGATRAGDAPGDGDGLGDADAVPGGAQYRAVRGRLDATPPPGHFETQCGFRVSGIGVRAVTLAAAARAAGGHAAVLDGDAGIVRVAVGHPASALVEFADGRGALLPALPGHVAALTYDPDDGELTAVEYEPSDNAPLHAQLGDLLPALRALRRTAAAASAFGTFEFERPADAEAFAGQLLAQPWLDPTLAVYAAHALHALQRRDGLADLDARLRAALRGATLFDVAMLARPPRRPAAPLESTPPTPVVPAVPLLAQGWGLLEARGVALVPPLDSTTLRRHLTGSPWTLFDPEGVALLRAALDNPEVP